MTPFKGKLRVRQLEILVCVAEVGSFSKAAVLQHISQSTLSRAVVEVEELVGGRLFERVSTGVTCTDLGVTMCRHARQLISDLRKAEVELAAVARGEDGILTIGCFSMFASWPLAEAAQRFQAQHPRVVLTIEVGTHEQLMGQLESGAIDVLISRYATTVNPQIYRGVTLLRDEIVLACSCAHPLTKHENSKLEDYVEFPWITALPGSRLRAELESSLTRQGLKIPTTIGALSPELGMEMLKRSEYLWLMPGSVAAIRRANGELFVLPAVPDLAQSPLCAIWARDRPSSRLMRAFSETVAQVVHDDRIALENAGYQVSSGHALDA